MCSAGGVTTNAQAGMMAVLILAVRRKKARKPSPVQSAADDGPAPPADVLVGGDAVGEGDVDGTRGVEEIKDDEEEEEEQQGEQGEQTGHGKEEQLDDDEEEDEDEDEDEDEEDEDEDEEGVGVGLKDEADAVVNKGRIETDTSVGAWGGAAVARRASFAFRWCIVCRRVAWSCLRGHLPLWFSVLANVYRCTWFGHAGMLERRYRSDDGSQGGRFDFRLSVCPFDD